MKRRNWKTCQPTSAAQALEWSLEHAREKLNLSVERVAERMGMPNHWNLYKWVNEGRLPAVLIPNFELVCGINLVTRWLVASCGQMLIAMPSGRTCDARDMQQLQEVLHATTGALLAFYAGQKDTQSTLADIQAGLESLAWHRGNVQQHDYPQLELGGHDND